MKEVIDLMVQGINEKRYKSYKPQIDCIGFGLSAYDRYDDGDNTWIEMNNAKSKWSVAYHEVRRYFE